jgi:hypothetical protein
MIWENVRLKFLEYFKFEALDDLRSVRQDIRPVLLKLFELLFELIMVSNLK